MEKRRRNGENSEKWDKTRVREEKWKNLKKKNREFEDERLEI